MTDDPLRTSLRYRWRIFWILAAGYVLVYFHRSCPAVVADDMMRDLAASGSLMGFLSAAYFYPYALMQLPAGLLSDSWGPRRTITLFFSLAVAGSFLVGAAPSAGWAVAGRGLVGIGVAMLFVSTMKVLAEWFEVRYFARMTGILMAMGGLGSLTAATPLAELSSWIGWRWSFVAVGGLTAVVVALVWAVVRDRPADLGLPSPTEHVRAGAPAVGLLAGVRRVFTCPSFWPLAVWFFFDCGVFFSFVGLWGGPYLMHVYGLTKSEAGRILSLAAAGLLVGSPLLSFASDALFRARKPVLLLSGVVVCALTAVLAFLTAEISLTGMAGLCFALGIFSSAIVVVAFTSAKELFPVQMAGTAVGLVNLFPFAGGAVFQQVLGAVLDHYGKVDGRFTTAGYGRAFLVLFGCAVVALLAALCMKETMKGRSRSTGAPSAD
jgi:sugar phosphate permease